MCTARHYYRDLKRDFHWTDSHDEVRRKYHIDDWYRKKHEAAVRKILGNRGTIAKAFLDSRRASRGYLVWEYNQMGHNGNICSPTFIQRANTAPEWRNGGVRQDFQQILRRKHPFEAMKHYKLKTVTYKTVSAPYLAIQTLQQLANTRRFIWQWCSVRECHHRRS